MSKRANLLVVCGLAGLLRAQPVLLESDSAEALQVTSVRTFAGQAWASLRPVAPSREIVVVVLLENLDAAQLAGLRGGLVELYNESNSVHRLRIALASPDGVTMAGPFRTTAQLQAALKEIPEPALAGRAKPLRYYSAAAAVAGLLEGDWRTVVLAGLPPALERATSEYAATYLATKFRARKLRLALWAPGGEVTPALTALARAASGLVLYELTAAARAERPAVEIDWPAPAVSHGFRLYTAQFLAVDGGVRGEASCAAVAPGTELPGVDLYADMQQRLSAAGELAAKATPSPEEIGQVKQALEGALSLNARDPAALRVAAALYRRAGDWATAASLLEQLSEVEPNDAQVWAALGDAQFQGQDRVSAERSLGRAHELNSKLPRVAEQLGRIRYAGGNAAGALMLFRESLSLDGNNQELWFTRAEAETRLGKQGDAAESLERGLALGGDHLDRRAALIRLYLEARQNEPALRQVEAARPRLPQEAEARSVYAGFLEQLGRKEDALKLWQSAAELAPNLEQAHASITRLKLEKGDLEGAQQAAAAGLASAPSSPALQLLNAELLERRGDLYGAREALSRAAGASLDLELLRRHAEMQDRLGSAAPAAYAAYVAALEKQAPASAEHRRAVERGLTVSLRDGDSVRAESFASQARALGGQASAAPAPGAGGRRNQVRVRGGLAALSFIAEGKARTSPHRFFAEYCQAVLAKAEVPDRKVSEGYVAGVRDYFRRVSELSGAGAAQSDRTLLTLSLADKAAQKETERILRLLGWKLKVSKSEVKVEAGENATQGRRQETSSALAIDEVGMQEALQARRPFHIEIPNEWADVLLEEKTWRTQFYPEENLPGGLAEALVREPRLARLYLGLSVVDDNTLQALVGGVGLKTLAEKYSELLFFYGSALASGPKEMILPGGIAAEAVWSKLVGASPREPARFMRALLDKDSGRLFAFYAAIAQLDSEHQRFFTLSAGRAGKFYELFRNAPEVEAGAGRMVRETSFAGFLREVPLDGAGHVDWPGSAEVWMVAKGGSHSAGKTGKLLKKLAKAVAPEVEDEILLRLAHTRYSNEKVKRSELDNFVAVARLDRHREEPLDEALALILAQHWAEYEAVYPYFAVLTGLGAADFQQFVAFGEAVRQLDVERVNTRLGNWNALVEILCLTQQAGAVSPSQAAGLFRSLTAHIAQAGTPAELAAVSLDSLREILKAAGGAAGGATPDEAVRNLLAGNTPPVAMVLDGAVQLIDVAGPRQQGFQRVLELQKIAPLAALYGIYDAARTLSAGKPPYAAAIQAIEASRGQLLAVEAPKSLKAEGKVADELRSFRPERLAEAVAKLKQKTAKKKIDPQDVAKLGQQVLEDIAPQVRWSLMGLVYAALLSPEDLLVSEDPLLLRKHQFVDLRGASHEIWVPSDLEVSSETTGSYALGGFADFAVTSGRIAAIGVKASANTAVAEAQFAALRGADYRHLRDRDLQRFLLTVRTAREWIVMAAGDAAVRGDLAESTLGLLSLGRRRDLLNALEWRDWPTVWEAPTLSDLYFLGRRYLARYEKDPWPSPVTAALRQGAEDEAGRLAVLGPVAPHLYGCSHPHLIEQPPYEEYQRYLFPTYMAERVAELKLYVALKMAEGGVPAALFPRLAEPLARELFKNLHMADMRDWRSVAAGFARLDGDRIQELLKQR